MYLIKQRLLAVGDDFDITDDTGTPVLHVDGKALSLRDRLVIEDLAGREVASVRRRLVALRRTWAISIGGDEVATMQKKLFTPFRDRFTVDVPGPDDLEVRGDLFDHDYVIERSGREIAQVSSRWFSVRDTYAVRIVDDEDHLLVLASVLALDLARAAEEEDERG